MLSKLRLCSGEHPVDLRDETAKREKERGRYASWSSAHRGKGIATVILYSNQIGGENSFLDMSFAKVIDFVKKHYEHLKKLIRELEVQKQAWFEKMRK